MYVERSETQSISSEGVRAQADRSRGCGRHPSGKSVLVQFDLIALMVCFDHQIDCAKNRTSLALSTRFQSSSHRAKNIPLGASGKSTASFRASRLDLRGAYRDRHERGGGERW